MKELNHIGSDECAREDEGLFRAIFTHAAVGIAQTSLNGEWLLVNDRLCEILGYTRDELRAKTFLEITYPEDREASLHAVRQLLNSEISSWLTEKRYFHKSGTIVWGRLFVSLVRDATERPQYFIAILEDVTDRIQSERALEEKQQQLGLALSTGLGVWECDLRGGAVGLSPPYKKVFGDGPLSYEEWMTLIHPEDRDRVLAIAREGVERTHHWEAEFRVLLPDGTVRWMLSKAAIILDGEGQPARMVGISLDVTERKRAEEQRSHLAALVESSDIAIISETVDGHIVSWNKGAERMFGYSAEEIKGKHISVLVPPERHNAIPGVLAKLAHGERIEHLEVQRVHKDGRLITAHLTLSPIRGADNSVVGISGVALDISDRKQAEAALRASEEMLRFAQSVASIGAFDYDLQTGGHRLTPELEAMYGLPEGAFARTLTDWENLLHPDDRAASLQRFKDSVDSGAPVEGEWRVVWPDGSLHWITGRWQVFKDGRGNPIRIMGVNFEITNRKHMEEVLRQSEERFRLAIKATNDAIWDIDLETGTVTWNETYSILYGRPLESSGSWDWWAERIHPDDRERTVEGLRTAINSDALGWTCDYRFQRADQTWAHIYDRCYISRDAAGRPWRVIGAMQDVTHRKEGEIALRESEERFRKVFEEGPLGLALIGRNNRFRRVNRALCEMVGYSEAELLQMSFPDLTYPDDVQTNLEMAQRLLQGELPSYCLQKRYVKKNGEIIWINLTATVLRNQQGEPLHGLAMIEDITQMKRAQEEALARQKLESVGLLASGIAHDFNNLLGGILAEAELAEAELKTGESPLESIQKIRTVARRGAEIVRELMIYAGQDNKDPIESIDLSKLVAEMLELLKVSISKHVVLQLDLPEGLPPVIGRASQLRQVVMNLIINASEAIGDKFGMIRITTSREVLSRGQVSAGSPCSLPGDYLKLVVSDSGAGMTKEVQARIFDPFFSTKFSGRGLGLAVVQRIVRDYEGAVNLVSAPGMGTSFEVFLPTTTGSDCPGQVIAALGSGRENRTSAGTVLIVEDEEALRVAISRLLRKKGFQVVEAVDGSSAFELLRNFKGIDLMLLDMTLPGISSRDVFDEVRGAHPGIKVILTSAHSKETVDSFFAGAQVEGFIRKPFQFIDLVVLLQDALQI